MSITKCVFLNPHWQGGADNATFDGVKEFAKLYLESVPYLEAPASREEATLEKERGIPGYACIKKQLLNVRELLLNERPEKIFAVDGSCDGDVAAIAYMNERLHGDLTLVWIDAHGDLNAPEESETKLFYGMPQRILLGGEREAFTEIVPLPLKPGQVVSFCARDLDAPERAYAEKNRLRAVSAEELAARPESALEAVRAAGNGNVYLHLDLDAFDPADVPNTAIPVPDGPKAGVILDAVRSIGEHANVVGFSINEYTPCGKRTCLMQRLADFGLSL